VGISINRSDRFLRCIQSSATPAIFLIKKAQRSSVFVQRREAVQQIKSVVAESFGIPQASRVAATPCTFSASGR
jgi:hypothetical protein